MKGRKPWSCTTLMEALPASSALQFLISQVLDPPIISEHAPFVSVRICPERPVQLFSPILGGITWHLVRLFLVRKPLFTGERQVAVLGRGCPAERSVSRHATVRDCLGFDGPAGPL